MRKPYLYILAICFFCCEEAPDFSIIESFDTPVVDIQTSETIFTELPIEIEWEGNTTAREFVYELQYVDDPSIVHSWSGSNTTSETSINFDNLDEGSYIFTVRGLYNQDNIGDVVTLDFTVDVISGPALRIYPLNQTAQTGDEIDVFLYFEEVPEELVNDAQKWREKMIESAVEANEVLMDKYLEKGDLSEEDIKIGLRERNLASEIIVTLCGAAFKNKGIQTLLDAVIDFLPAPNQIKPVTGVIDDKGTKGFRKADDNEPFSGLAFKIATDPYVGSLTFVRVYSGTLKSGDSVFLPRKGKKERIGRMLQMHSNKRKEIDEVRAGDICAVIGLKQAVTGETLCDERNQIVLEEMNFPEPVISVAVEPKTKEDQEKMGIALGRLAQEDPSFKMRTDEESGQTIISGMGELHLEVLVERMRREFNVEANTGKPRVAYRETIKKLVEQEGKYIKQSGGRGQYGHVYIRIEPLISEEKNYEFVNEIVGGTIPKEFISAVDKGCREQMEAGVIAGYPLVKVKVSLYDGSYHDVDSSEIAFKVAGSIAFKDGALKAGPVLLEPIMSLEVVTPEEYMGDVVGDLSRRRGVIGGMEDGASGKIISGEVPLAEMFGYATDLRSATQGRATFTMEPLKYSEVPRNVAEAVINKNE